MACNECYEAFRPGESMRVLVDDGVQLVICKRPGPWRFEYRYYFYAEGGGVAQIPTEGTWLLEPGERVVTDGL